MSIKTTIVLDSSVEGHHLEYLNHFYNHAVKLKQEKFVFCLPREFQEIANKLIWPASDTIQIVLFDQFITSKLNKGSFTKAYYLSRYLRTLVKEKKATDIFAISLMELMPFIPFFLYKKVKISGIIYLIYLYRWKKSSIINKAIDVLKYLIFSRLGVFKNVFLLNDTIAPRYLNKKFNTNVFKYLPDPLMITSFDPLNNLKLHYQISDDKIVCLHFGALAERKGTLEILEAILQVNKSELKKFSFIFAGRVNPNIQERFYQLLTEVQKITDIIVVDEYVDYSFICNLCQISNFVIIPYKNTEQSSGVIAYSSHFNVPVVAPRIGLLGKIIRRNKLGVLLDNSSSESIKNFLNNAEDYKYLVKSNYLKNNTVSQFVNIIFKE
jgi:glycosyltransferase involved in cell wall biosynthesis